MTREEIYNQCVQKIDKTNCLLLESATGTGKSRIAINLINHLCNTVYKGREVTMLLLVAKRVHKQTWKDEIEKWGGIKVHKVIMECYESLHKYQGHYDIILSDEVHHIGSELRLELMQSIQFGYFIGLSATIPLKLKQYFKYRYHAQVVSCDIIEAIEDNILPEPTILLFPLKVENTRQSETIEINPKASGSIVYGEYKDLWKCKRNKVHAILRCTQRQKLDELNKMIDWFKDKTMLTNNPAMKQSWLHFCGKRLEFLADCKLQWVKMILQHLSKERTITFCKTIAQTEELGKNCIHSQNKLATKIYDDFNNGKINHITAVNILNENANLVNCRYGIFCNITSSDLITTQRQGRLLRHKDPIMIIPYYEGTREEELVIKAVEGFSKIKMIKSINEI